MRTITTLLMTCFVLAGTFNTVSARDDARSERATRQKSEIKVKREISAEHSRDVRGNGARTTERQTDVQMPNRRQQVDLRVSTTEVRREQADRDERPNREIRRNENERRVQPRMENRSNERHPDFNRRANLSYHERQQRCTFCSGRGFTLHIDGFRHLRCNHCEGRGIRVYREMYVNACPNCYDPLQNGQLGCSLEELAWAETNRIAFALELSDHQRNRIFTINYRYITHHYNGDYYPTSRRDREIRRVLQLGQVVAFAIFLNELHEGELCYNCTNGRY